MSFCSSLDFGEMMNLKSRLSQFLQDQDGPTAVEYAVMLALIVAICVGAIQTLAIATRDNLDNSAQAIGNAFGP
jgi:pilus assembly protein Flp/PilA